MFKSSLTKASVLLAAVTIGTGSFASAQSVWLGPRSPDGITVELNKPFLDAEDYSFGNLSLFLTGQFGIVGNTKGIIELPVVRSEISGSGESNNEINIGNPYIGLRSTTANGRSSFELGVRLPLTGGDGLWLFPGAMDNIDRWGSFGKDIVSVSAALNQSFGSGPASFVLRLNPSFLVSTEGGDPELFVNYSGFGWFGESNVQLGAGLLGWAIVTESDLSLKERTVHHVGFAVRVDLDSVVLGVKATTPLDEDLRDAFNGTLGVNVTVPFARRP